MGNWYSCNPDPDIEFTPRILEIHIEPISSDFYGMLEKGILYFEGKVTMAFSLPEMINDTGSPQHRNYSHLSPKRRSEGYITTFRFALTALQPESQTSSSSCVV